MTITTIRSFIIRHRFAIRNWSLLVVATLVAIYGAFAVDVFEYQGTVGLRQAQVELDEALLIGLAIMLTLLAFGARHYIAQRREVARRIAAERHARELAYQDGLTGLPNRRQFDDALRAALGAPPRAGGAHALFLLDLNGFKGVNDVHGHGVGDELLVVVAQRLTAAMRNGDMVARFGGDEFAILARHLAGPEAATSVALRVIDALDAPITAGGAVQRIGVGIGIALLPTDATTSEEALRKADVALYRAKAERRSASRFFEPEMDARVAERAALEAALRDAMELDQVQPRFTPVYDLANRSVRGFEATPLWLDPEGREIPPERFISIAEEVGLIHALFERLLRTCVATARDWPSDVTLAMDVYPTQLRDRLLPAQVTHILDEGGFAAERLELEITESALVSDTDNAQAVLGSLRAAGVRIALDNFGTGYSSLYHLRSLRIDKVKIDRSFVQAMRSEGESASIVHALVGLGQGLGLTVVAEGVADACVEEALRTSGVEQGQVDPHASRLTAEQSRILLAAAGQQQAVGDVAVIRRGAAA